MVLSVFEESAGILKTFTEWAERGKKKKEKAGKGERENKRLRKKKDVREKRRTE